MSTSQDDKPIADLVDALDSIDTNTDLADLNSSTISDNNGGRIELENNNNLQKPYSANRDLNQGGNKVIKVTLKKPKITRVTLTDS